MKTAKQALNALLFTAGCMALATPLAAAPTTHPMAVQDLLTLKRVGAPVASTDGNTVVWQQTETDPATLARKTGLWFGSADGKKVFPSWFGDASAPAFSPDGRRIYFLSSRSGSNQLWVLHLDVVDASPTQVSHFTTDVGGFLLSPDGKRIVVWGETTRDCATLGCEKSPSTTLPGPGEGRFYPDGAGFVRHWDVWTKAGVLNRSFAFALDAAGAITGEGTPLDGPAGALTGDTPTKPDGGNEDLAWAADSRSVFFVARRSDRNEPRSTNLDIWRSSLDGKAPENLTAKNLATDRAPAPSPDGKWLAYAAMARPGYESDRQVVMLRNLATGETRSLTQGWDRSVASLAWTSDGKALIATADDVLDHPAFRIDIETGKATRLKLAPSGTTEGHLGGVTPMANGALLYTRDSVSGPAEVWLAPAGKPARQISHANDAQLAATAGITVTRFSFTGAGGDTVWGMVEKPAAAPNAKLPVLLFVHGGPQGSFGDDWSFRWNPRLFAEQGYAVVSVDFHGSTGYGQSFTDAINRNWGGWPLEDLQKGLTAALAKDPALDGSRTCALGASYGGYMMNWIEGNWADRFKCLVQHDGVFDARAMAYETDELWFDTWEHGGHTYFDAPQEFEKWNPVNHVADWKTPMLVITGEHDFRIPYTQGLASYAALQMRGVPSEMLVFPDENHWVLKSKDSAQWHATVFAWLTKWLKP